MRLLFVSLFLQSFGFLWAEISFNRDIRPILSENCLSCHGADAKKAKGKLQLHTFELATKALGKKKDRWALVPGDLEKSELWYRIVTDDEDDLMPPEDSHKTLSEVEKELIKAWILSGAKYEKHWAFISPEARPLPALKHPWIQNSIDAFVLDKLSKQGLEPAVKARPDVLLRRLFLDLTGLPPTLQQLEAFAQDSSFSTYERQVDELLNSPHYAERMALDWLDAARYADTNGYQIDDRRDMWAWRDWAIHAFAENKPYDTFIIEQVAGDLIENASVQQKVATGFLRNSMSTHEGGVIPEEYRVSYNKDKVDVVATSIMGLTLKCAGCHDHKYDPISQKEYYQFYAFFNTSSEKGVGAKHKNSEPVVTSTTPYFNENKIKETMEKRIKTLEVIKARLIPKDVEPKIFIKTLNHEISVLNKIKKAGKVSTMVMDHGERKTNILIRGQYDQPGEEVRPGFPAFLPTPEGEELKLNRLGLAKWLVRKDHPLTARVMVNRVWQMIMGKGLVKSSEDFGTQGSWPSHPGLLDHLAYEFSQHWNVKRLVKKIIMSSTYMQSSKTTPDKLLKDPQNEFYSRAPRFRLVAEIIRDQALFHAGLLNKEIGGPSVFPKQPGLWKEISHFGYPSPFTAQIFLPSRGRSLYRRSLYTFLKRSSPPPNMTTFDAPTREICTVRRSTTNTPLQAFVLMNDPQFFEAALHFGKQLQEKSAHVKRKISEAYQRVTGHRPSLLESKILQSSLQKFKQHFEDHPQAAHELLELKSHDKSSTEKAVEQASYVMLASTLLNLDETITRQ